MENDIQEDSSNALVIYCTAGSDERSYGPFEWFAAAKPQPYLLLERYRRELITLKDMILKMW